MTVASTEHLYLKYLDPSFYNNPRSRLQKGVNARNYAEKYLDKESILKQFEYDLLELC